jgi:hypothetical protein
MTSIVKQPADMMRMDTGIALVAFDDGDLHVDFEIHPDRVEMFAMRRSTDELKSVDFYFTDDMVEFLKVQKER